MMRRTIEINGMNEQGHSKILPKKTNAALLLVVAYFSYCWCKLTVAFNLYFYAFNFSSIDFSNWLFQLDCNRNNVCFIDGLAHRRGYFVNQRWKYKSNSNSLIQIWPSKTFQIYSKVRTSKTTSCTKISQACIKEKN